MPDDSLVVLVRRKLDNGTLPHRDGAKTWVGYGSSQSCRVCDAPIHPAQVEYEFDMPDGDTMKMHAGCHGLWLAELFRRGWIRQTRQPRDKTPPEDP